MLHRLVQFLEFSCSILGLPKYDGVDNQFTISIEVNLWEFLWKIVLVKYQQVLFKIMASCNPPCCKTAACSCNNQNHAFVPRSIFNALYNVIIFIFFRHHWWYLRRCRWPFQGCWWPYRSHPGRWQRWVSQHRELPLTLGVAPLVWKHCCRGRVFSSQD